MLPTSAIIRIAKYVISQEQEIGIGYTWSSLGFNKEEIKKEIIGEVYNGNGVDCWLVNKDGGPFPELICKDEINSEIERDQANVEFQKKQQEDRERAHLEEYGEHLEGFLDTLPPKLRGRVEPALTKRVRNKGNYPYLWELIEEFVSNGAQISELGGKRILQTPDSSFFYEKDITKSGIDYAEYLISQGI